MHPDIETADQVDEEEHKYVLVTFINITQQFIKSRSLYPCLLILFITCMFSGKGWVDFGL